MCSLTHRRGTNYILAGDFIDGPHFLIYSRERIELFLFNCIGIPCIDNYSIWTADQKPLSNDTFHLKLLQLRTSEIISHRVSFVTFGKFYRLAHGPMLLCSAERTIRFMYLNWQLSALQIRKSRVFLLPCMLSRKHFHQLVFTSDGVGVVIRTQDH